uniref:uncharacterized protein LOC109958012 isoform X2 n=1 Tax=Monopterus albus TaxID=43700 RepID=UPI0009B32890|nr:uncharacterized protein LOC109958012 isoform X2 [Monopterus albus]
MAETIVTFQSQLSGVMETVFKAAMFEITRLVEDSFLEEVTRCREQVESLKRRLKWSENRREGDRRGRCVECGRVGVSVEGKNTATEKSLKQERLLQEEINSSQTTDPDRTGHEGEEVKPEVHNASKATQCPGVQGEKLDRLLKKEALRFTPETNESQERWGVNLDETSASGLPGPSKYFSVQRIPKCHENWEASFNQRPDQDGHSSDPSEPLFQSRASQSPDSSPDPEQMASQLGSSPHLVLGMQ